MAGKSKHYEVKEQIEVMIHQGEYPIGSQLPPEPELADFFNVSRGTIRQALSILAQDAVISRRSAGTGTFVIREPKQAQVMSFTQQVRAADLKPSTRVLAKERITAGQIEAGPRIHEAFLLDLEEGVNTPIYRIDRLRCGDEQPLARQTLYLLAQQFKPDFLEREDFSQSIFDVYARYHRRVVWADEIISARPTTPEEMDLFKLQDLPLQQQFVYERNRVSYDQENVAVEVMISIDRSDFFRAYRYRIMEDTPRLEGGGD